MNVIEPHEPGGKQCLPVDAAEPVFTRQDEKNDVQDGLRQGGKIILTTKTHLWVLGYIEGDVAAIATDQQEHGFLLAFTEREYVEWQAKGDWGKLRPMFWLLCELQDYVTDNPCIPGVKIVDWMGPVILQEGEEFRQEGFGDVDRASFLAIPRETAVDDGQHRHGSKPPWQ